MNFWIIQIYHTVTTSHVNAQIMFQVILINIPAFATSHKYMKDIYNSLSTVGHFTTHTFTYQINLNSSRTKQDMEELQTQIF